jgi:hypothetical protein
MFPPDQYNRFMMILKAFLIVGVIYYAFKCGRILYWMVNYEQ